jgi:hypothetical protein
MIATPDTHEPWPEADDPEAAALREAVSVALGLIISFTPHEGERQAAFNTLVAAHKRALVARSIGHERLN